MHRDSSQQEEGGSRVQAAGLAGAHTNVENNRAPHWSYARAIEVRTLTQEVQSKCKSKPPIQRAKAQLRQPATCEWRDLVWDFTRYTGRASSRQETCLATYLAARLHGMGTSQQSDSTPVMTDISNSVPFWSHQYLQFLHLNLPTTLALHNTLHYRKPCFMDSKKCPSTHHCQG